MILSSDGRHAMVAARDQEQASFGTASENDGGDANTAGALAPAALSTAALARGALAEMHGQLPKSAPPKYLPDKRQLSDHNNCETTCFGKSCDYWIELAALDSNDADPADWTCEVMESTYDCNCDGCDCIAPAESPPTPLPTPCASNFTLFMYDSYGDGWNLAYWQWSNSDGEAVSSGTLDNGASGSEPLCNSGSGCHTLQVGYGNARHEISWQVVATNSGSGEVVVAAGGAGDAAEVCPGQVLNQPSSEPLSENVTDNGCLTVVMQEGGLEPSE